MLLHLKVCVLSSTAEEITIFIYQPYSDLTRSAI